jgi:hypothetical protein
MLSLFLGLLLTLILFAKVVTFGGMILALVILFVVCRLTMRLARLCFRGPSQPTPPRAWAGRPPTPCGSPRECRVVEHPIPPRNRPQDVSARPPQRSAPSWPLLAVALAFFCLVALGFRITNHVQIAAEAEPSPQTARHATISARNNGKVLKAMAEARPAATAENKDLWSVTVTGTGEGVNDARQDALDKACTELTVYLRSQNPPVDWTPSPEYVRQHLVKEKDWRKEADLEKDDPVVGRLTISKVSLNLEVGAKERDEILKLDQHYRTEQRMLWLGRVLAGLVALLAAVAGYVRLDEWSKGYYTGWLRLAAAGLIGAVVAGVWWLR